MGCFTINVFIEITVITCFIAYSNLMLVKASVAIGRVREVSLYMTPSAVTHLLLVYIVLKLGWSPVAVYWVGSVPAFMWLFVDF